jgi:hypothetical protein
LFSSHRFLFLKKGLCCCVDGEGIIARPVAVRIRHDGLALLAGYRNLPPNSAVGATVITGYTSQNPLWWIALALCLVLGLAITRSWRGPLGLWIALAVTGLIPAAFLALFLVLIVKLKQTSQGLG